MSNFCHCDLRKGGPKDDHEHAGSTRCREHRKRVDNGASPLPGVQNITWVDCPGHLEDAA